VSIWTVDPAVCTEEGDGRSEIELDAGGCFFDVRFGRFDWKRPHCEKGHIHVIRVKTGDERFSSYLITYELGYLLLKVGRVD